MASTDWPETSFYHFNDKQMKNYQLNGCGPELGHTDSIVGGYHQVLHQVHAEHNVGWDIVCVSPHVSPISSANLHVNTFFLVRPTWVASKAVHIQKEDSWFQTMNLPPGYGLPQMGLLMSNCSSRSRISLLIGN